MKTNVSARPLVILAALLATVAIVLAAGAMRASALEGVTIQASSTQQSYPANTWAPLSVEAANTNANYDITVLEAGFRALPDGLELKEGHTLATTYAAGQKVIAKGTSALQVLHSMDVRKVVASPAPSTPTTTPKSTTPTTTKTATKTATTAKTGDAAPVLPLALAGLVALVAAVAAVRRGRAGMLGVLAASALAAGVAGGAAAFFPAAASAATTTETAECAITIKIDGQDYTFDGYVTYTYEAADPAPTPEPEPVPETVDIRGVKTWNDENDQDGKRPDSVTVELLADNAVVDAATVTAENDWHYTFADKPKHNAAGAEIVYTVVEAQVADYTSVRTGTDLANSYTPGKTQLNVLKVWDDANNQDGIRPAFVTVKLLADGVDTGKTQVLGPENDWEASFTDLDEKADGKTITYTVQEAPVEGYESTVEVDGVNATITNTHLPDTITVSGTKTWNDANDQDGLRPASITIRLHADGEVVATTTASAQTNWRYSFENLPKYDAGTKVVYTVTEDVEENYTSTIAGFDIANANTPGKTEVEVTKQWDDAHNQDGLRPELVEVRLLANGEDAGVAPLILSAANNWADAFTNLDEYKDGQRIAYTVEEAATVQGYTSSTTGNATEGFVIKNTHVPATTSVSGTKTWNDANDQDGKRPEAVTIDLLADNAKVHTARATAEGNWAYSFDNLPVYANGKRIAYTVVEEHVPDYSSAVAGFNIANSYTPGVTELFVEKRWNDADNQDGIRPTSAVVELLANGQETGMSATLSDANNWQHTFADLPEMEEGKKVAYTVEELAVEGYTAVAETSADGTRMALINTHVPETVDLYGAKTWNDADDQDGVRPEAVTVRLHANGVEVARAQALAQGDWRYSFGRMPKYEAGKEIVYTLTEDRVEGYTHAINGLNVTNSYTPGKTQVDVSKVWDDDNNRDGVRPASVTVRLTKADATGAQVPVEGVAPLVLSAADKWTGTFEDLDEYDDGEPIAYGVVEDAVGGYTSQVTGSAEHGFVITNHHEPETVQIEVEKIWYDDEMFDAQGNPLGDYKRPGSVTIALYDENNQEVGRADVSEAGSWKHTWTLPKKAGGQDIDYQEYTVAEPEGAVPAGFGSESGHPDALDASGGHYRAVVLNAPYVREDYTPVEVKLFKYSEAQVAPADPDAEEPRDVPLPGVKFSVTKVGADGAAGTGGEPQTLTTDANGKATFTAGRPDEKIVVKETETLDGYYNNGATFTLGVEKGELERLTFDADAGEWVKTYGLYTEALAEGKSPEDLTIETPPLNDPDGNYLEENENTYILRNTPLATLVVEKNFIGAGMRTYEEAPKEFAITLSYTDAAGNAQEKKLTVDPYGEYWNSGGNPSLCRWLVPGIPYNAEVTIKERGLGKQGYALTNTEAFVWRMDSNAPRYESDMTDEAQVSADNTSVTFSMPAHFDPDPVWKYSEEYGGGSLGVLGARVRFQNHYSREIDITGTKLWRDGGRTHDNASEVTLTLYRRVSGNVDAEQVAGATPTWDGNTYTFADQPISDRSGNGYVYWVIEEPVEGYDAPKHTSGDGDATGVPGAPNGGLITNELSQDYVDITVTKKWDDASDQDGKRPDEPTLALYRTGKDGDETYTQEVKWVTWEVSKSGNDWTYTFKNQLKYDSDRSEFIYEVREATVPDGYTVSYADASGTALGADATGAPNGGTITNTHTPETVTISGTKRWNDDNNRDGKRPASITVNLLADNAKVDSKTVEPDASGAWAFSFADKPVYKDGAAITYTVEEEAVEGYTAEVRGFNITNTHAPERVSISGTKEWKHAEGGDADPTVDNFTVKLQKTTDGTTWTDVASQTVVARTTDPAVTPNAWTFANQYKYENGVELKYRCIESPTIPGWVATEGTAGNGYKITNTTSQEQISFNVKKIWEDNNNAAGKRPTSVKVGLYRYDSSVAGGYAFVKEIELSAASNWQATVTANKYHNGTEATYTVREMGPMADGYYQRMVTGSATDGFEIKNERPEITISGRKTWSVPTGTDTGLFPKPESITVHLQKKDGDTWTTVETKTVPTSGSGADEWTFANVAKIDSKTKDDIEYRVAEEPVPGWKVSPEGTAANSYNIVNILDNPTTVRLVKTWDDNNNAEGFRPGTEAFANGGYLKLLRNGVDTGLKPQVIYLSSSPNIYTVTWTVPASDTATYTVQESPVPGYVAGTISGSGTRDEPYRLTNTLSTTISGTKTWTSSSGNNDDLDTSKIPEKYTVRLEKSTDGTSWTTVTSQEVASYMASPPPSPTDPIPPTDEWTFDNQPKYENGVELQYRVVEVPVPDGFTMSGGTKDVNGEYNITNTYSEASSKITISGKKTWRFPTLPTSLDALPSEIKVTLEAKDNDSGEWNPVAASDAGGDSNPKTIEVTELSEIAECIIGDTGITPPETVEGGEWSWTVDKEDSQGRAIEYRVVEEAIEGFSTTGGSKADGYNITNTYISTSGVNFSFVFDSNDRETVPWIVKTKNKTVNDFVSAQLDNGTTVYKYLYTHEVWNDLNEDGVQDEEETETVTDTYYCQIGTVYPYRYYDWYASLEASSVITDYDLLVALETSVPVKEDVEKTFVYGCFKPDVAKQVSISGTTEGGDPYTSSFDMTLGADKVYNVNLEPGTYEVTVPFVSDGDIDAATINSGVASIHAGDTITMVTTIKLTVSRNASDELECTVDQDESRYTDAGFASDTSIDTWGIWSDSMGSSSTGIGLSAAGNTVNITNYLYCSTPIVQ